MLGCRSVERTPRPITTIDNYCARQDVNRIDVIKCDTQGFELEVLRGAVDTIERHRIHMIFMEVTLSPMYVGAPPFYEPLRFLVDRGRQLVSFYEMFYQDNRLSWTDVLFVDPKYRTNIEHS